VPVQLTASVRTPRPHASDAQVAARLGQPSCAGTAHDNDAGGDVAGDVQINETVTSEFFGVILVGRQDPVLPANPCDPTV
jgi:hypothetical protein